MEQKESMETHHSFAEVLGVTPEIQPSKRRAAYAPVAQLDRVPPSEGGGCPFEPGRVHCSKNGTREPIRSSCDHDYVRQRDGTFACWKCGAGSPNADISDRAGKDGRA